VSYFIALISDYVFDILFQTKSVFNIFAFYCFRQILLMSWRRERKDLAHLLQWLQVLLSVCR